MKWIKYDMDSWGCLGSRPG